MKLNKIKLDKKKYKYLTLKNDLDVLLISNKNTNRSTVALTINIGSLYNKIEGLAHFLEHMLFMGCKKYPNENHFFSTINRYGGISNAFTTNNFTSYYFTVDDEHLFESIDIFHNFFIDPLFKNDSINREIIAVNSEYEKNMSIENRKIEEILKDISENSHPYKLFDCGNKKTLNVKNIRDNMIDFYNTYYSSDLMKLVISSNHSLDELTELSLLFENIPKKKINKINKLDFPIVKKHNGNCIKYIEMLTTNKKNKLTFVWQLKNDNIYNKEKPLLYITYLLQHESTSSLNYLLSKIGYIYDMEINYEYMGYDNYCIDDIYMFYIQFILTPIGQKNINIILMLLEHYICSIKKNGVNFDIYNEMINISKINVLYSNNSDVNTITDLSIQMHLYDDVKNILINKCVYDEYSDKTKNIICKYLDEMTIKNCIVIYISKFKKLLKKTKWYGAEYNTYDNVPGYTNTNHDFPYFSFQLNPYVIDKLNIINYRKKSHELSKVNNVLYKHIDTYNNSTICSGIIYHSELINNDIINYICCELYILSLYEINKPIYYFGKQMEMYFSIHMSYNKLIIRNKGYYDNIIPFLLDIRKNFFDFKKMKKIFDKIKMEYLENLDNFKYIGSYSYAKYVLKKEAENNFFPYDEKIKNVGKITFDIFVETIKKIFNSFQTQFLICGNINNKIISEIKKMFNIGNNKYINDTTSFAKKLTLGQIININENTLDEKEINSVINITFQLFHINIENIHYAIYNICLSNLLKIMISESFFNVLRTKKQFGYIVKCSTTKLDREDNPLMCMSFVIQSTKNLNEIEENIFKFLLEYRETLEKMNLETFESYKNTMINLLEKKYDTIEEEFDFYFKLVHSNLYVFNYIEITIDTVNKISMDEFLTFYNDFFINEKNRAYWNVKILGNK